MMQKFMETFIESTNEAYKGLNKPNLTFSDVLSNLPQLSRLLHTFNAAPDLLDTLLSAVITDPQKLAELLTSGSVCEITPAQLRSVFSLGDTVDSESVRDILCEWTSANLTSMLQELADELLASNTQSLRFTQLIEEYKRTGDINLLQQQLNTSQLAFKLLEIIEQWQTMEVIKMPNMDIERLVGIIEAFASRLENGSTEDTMRLAMVALAPLYGTDAWQTVSMYSESYALILDYISDMSSRLNLVNGTLDLADLFDGAQSWQTLLENTLQLQPETAKLLNGVSVKFSEVCRLIFTRV